MINPLYLYRTPIGQNCINKSLVILAGRSGIHEAFVDVDNINIASESMVSNGKLIGIKAVVSKHIESNTTEVEVPAWTIKYIG